jgi:uncharacterized protein
MLRRHWFLSFCAAMVALGIMLAVLVPHRSGVPTAPSLAFRDHVIFDNVGLLSPAFDSAKSGQLLQSESFVQFLVYIAARRPQGDFENYTLETASAWNVGAEHADNGVVLFIFPDNRIARLEVGYGLEGALPDGLMRDILDQTLVAQFARGAYEAGVDELMSRILTTLGEDAAVRSAEVASASRVGMVRSAFMRVPRLARLAWRMFVDAELNGRLAVEMFVFVFMSVVGSTLFFLYKVIAAVVLLPRRWRDSPAKRTRREVRERNAAQEDGRRIEYPPPLVDVLGDIRLFDIVMGSAGFALSFVFLVAFMIQVEDFIPRKGHFGGAGVTVLWAIPPGSAPR